MAPTSRPEINQKEIKNEIGHTMWKCLFLLLHEYL